MIRKTVINLAVACLAVGALGTFAKGAHAFDLRLPDTSELVREEHEDESALHLPTGVFADGHVPTRKAEGRVTRRTWRITSGPESTAGVIEVLREQIEEEGFTLLLDCETEDCGGFDFRFAVEVLPPPYMFVDLADFRYLAAGRVLPDGVEGISVLVSRTDQSGMIQILQIEPASRPAITITPSPIPAPTADPAPASSLDQPQTSEAGDRWFMAQIRTLGSVTLSDLTFETGSSKLVSGDFQSLEELAAFLREDSSRQIVLVGHTDNEGALDRNVTLSRRRAASVLERLVADYDVDRGQLVSQGVGYLAPLISNATPEGREANRRVDAVLVTGQ